jgi:hypothetical protein
MIFTLPDLVIMSQQDAPYITTYGIHVVYTIPLPHAAPAPAAAEFCDQTGHRKWGN